MKPACLSSRATTGVPLPLFPSSASRPVSGFLLPLFFLTGTGGVQSLLYSFGERVCADASAPLTGRPEPSEAGEDKGRGRQLGSNVTGTGTTPRGERNTRI